MIAVDTNILVYAHREEFPHHAAALASIRSLVESGRRWAIPWPCLHEFYGLVTNPRVLQPAASAGEGVQILRQVLALPGLETPSESGRHATLMLDLVTAASVVGARIHDAKIAAICLGHGIDELWTADRDFGMFPALRTRNPLVK